MNIYPMKNFRLLLSIFMSTLIGNIVVGQSYCVPPNFLSGPFTGIQSVKLADAEKSSEYSDGYSDYTLVDFTTLKPGNTYDIDLRFYYAPSLLSSFSGNLNFRLWADWNQDFDFNDADETILSKIVDCTGVTELAPSVDVTFTFTVPSTAKLGTTRIRLYEDMLTTDGHITPNPCGYLNDAGGLGQHGECEDYKLTLSNTSGISKVIANQIKVYPNPFEDQLFFSETVQEIKIYNVVGSLLLKKEELLNSIDMSDIEKGIILVSFTTLTGEKRTVRVTHI
jgi:GEVED domain/Secretion system C-terminal sorting domain